MLCLAFRPSTGQQNEAMARGFGPPGESLSSLSSDDPWIIRKRVGEVTLFFTATYHHRFVQDLAPEDIHVSEDGRSVDKIWAFGRQCDLPFRLGLLIDTSASVNTQFRFEKESAIRFLQRMVRPGADLAFVIGFSDDMHLTQDFTDDLDSLAHGVTVLENHGGTALFDAIRKASEKLATAMDDQPIARVLIILSDGNDNASQVGFAQALNGAVMQDVTIYTVNTRPDSMDPPNMQAVHEGDAILKRLAEQTGGRSFSHMDVSDVAKAFTAIEQEMRNRFALSYRPLTLTEDGRFRHIEITARRSGHKLHVNARKGYYIYLKPSTE